MTVLIERYHRKILNYIRMMVRDSQTADDIFQETFIKAIKSIREGKYSDDGKFISWVLRIAHNQIIDHFRSSKKSKHVTSDDAGYDLLNNRALVSDELNIEEQLIRGQIADDVRRLIEELPEEQREVVVLRHYFDLSFKEIADQTGVSINTALGRMRYALINLRKMIDRNQMNLAV